MLKLITLYMTVAYCARIRLEEAKRDERGVSTLEMVVLGLGMFLAATAAIAVITLAITNRTDLIK